MARIVDYKIENDSSSIHLSQKVRVAISEGWQPHGAMTISPDDYCYQPMVKYEELVPLTAVRELPPGVALVEPSWKRAIPAVTEEE